MITPSFSLTAAERVLPKLALDFTTASLDPRVTFTRSGNTATVTNADGSITLVNANLPRFDYVGGVCEGLLIEESRTNSLLNSLLDGAVAGSPGTAPTSWTNGSTTGSISAIETASYAAGYKLTFSCSTTRRGIFQQPASVANTTYTFSATVEVVSGVGTPQYIELYQLMNVTALPAGATISAYVLDGASAVNTSRVFVGTHKISLTITTAAATGTPAFAIGVGLQGNATGVAKFSNVQVERGAFATSYIPTTVTQVTRTADNASMTGANFSDWFNSSAGSLVVECDNGQGAVPAICSVDGTSSPLNRIAIYQQDATGSPANVTKYRIWSSGTVIVDFNLTRVSGGYGFAGQTDSYAGSVDGGAVSTDSSGTFPVLSALYFYDPLNVRYLNGHVQSFYYWPQRITNNEVQAFSKG